MAYSTAEDVLAASRAGFTSQRDLLVRARRSAVGDVAFMGREDLLGAADRVTFEAPPPPWVRGGGFPRLGSGRTPGLALVIRDAMYNVIVVLLTTSAYLNLTELFESEDAALVDLGGLCNLRDTLVKVTYQALRTMACDLPRSGALRMLLKFGSGGSRDDKGQHLAVAVQASLTSKGVVFTCSEAESCLREEGCYLQEPMERALEAVRKALGAKAADVFEILSASLRMRS